MKYSNSLKLKYFRNRMEEYIKEIDELKQLYVKVCSEKEQSSTEKEKIEKRLDELSAQFETLDKQYGAVVKGRYLHYDILLNVIKIICNCKFCRKRRIGHYSNQYKKRNEC